MRILIVLFGALGDVTQALLVAVRIKKAWPEARLTWAVEPKSAGLLKLCSAVDEIIIFKRELGVRGYFDFIKNLRKHSYDLTIDLQRHLKSGVTSYFSGAPRRLGFHRANAKEFNWLFNNERIARYPHYMLKLDHYYKFCDHLGLEQRPIDYGIVIPDQSRLRALELLSRAVPEANECSLKYVVLIIGATWQSKLWKVEGYVDVANYLYATRNLIPVIVGGAGERAFAERVQARLSIPIANLVGQTDIAELSAVLERSSFVVGVDTGPMHLAAALGKRVTSLWGATSPLRSSPFGNADLVIQSAAGCSPCYRRNCPGLGSICMQSISAEAVIAQIQRVMPSSS